MIGVPNYSRAPVVEAVFEFRFEGLLSTRELERLRDRLSTKYPAVEDRRNVEVQILPDGRAVTNASLIGFQMTAADARYVTLLQSNAFGTIKQAPYVAWEELISTARANYSDFEKVAGRKTFNRIATRFTNRIDIPNEALGHGDITDWFNAGTKLPPRFAGSLKHFSFAEIFEYGDGRLSVLLQGGTVEQVLLNHTSVLLDIDVYLDRDVPQHKDALWETAQLLRTAKNDVFEATITDRVRELIA